MANRPRRNAATNDSDSSTTAAGAAARAKRKKSPSQQQRSSAYRGVTRHRWTGRFEAHLWDRGTWNHHEEPQQAKKKKKKKKGKQVYLGAYDDEEAAARAHDLAALKYWGPGTVLNFPLCRYDEELKAMEGQSREEYIGSVRRKSSGFSRGVSKYRGVARHHHNGRWEARIGRVLGNKYLYLGTYATQEEAAVAYDVAAIEHRGLNAVTNFDIGHYVNWHRRRRILLGEEVIDATEVKPVQLPADDLTGHARATTIFGLDETVTAAAAVFHCGEHHFADSCVVQLPAHDHQVTRTTPVHEAPPPPSALDLLLLQSSPKFNEIMEEQVISAAAVTTATTESSSTSSPSPSCTSSSSLSLEQQPEELISGGASSSARCSFPDDVQTYFQCDDDDGMMSGLAFAEVDTFLFGDLGAYAAPMFQGDLDVYA